MARAGWENALHAVVFHALANDGFPGWDKREDEPHSLLLEFVYGAGNESSLAVASAWDDIARGQFYYRDITDSGLPIAHNGDVYSSRFFFQFASEVNRFSQWIKRRGVKPTVSEN